MEQLNRELRTFLDTSPTCYHAVKNVADKDGRTERNRSKDRGRSKERIIPHTQKITAVSHADSAVFCYSQRDFP